MDDCCMASELPLGVLQMPYEHTLWILAEYLLAGSLGVVFGGAFRGLFLTFPPAPCYTEDNRYLLPQGVFHEAGAFA
jgi:hypothetical protein